MQTSFAFWAPLIVRGFIGVVALLLLRDAIHALRGRPVVVPGESTRVFGGWSARLVGALALVFALILALWALVGMNGHQ